MAGDSRFHTPLNERLPMSRDVLKKKEKKSDLHYWMTWGGVANLVILKAWGRPAIWGGGH